jgi:hypothetical protein
MGTRHTATYRPGAKDSRERYGERVQLLVEQYDGQDCFFVLTFSPWGALYDQHECISLEDAQALFDSLADHLRNAPII